MICMRPPSSLVLILRGACALAAIAFVSCSQQGATEAPAPPPAVVQHAAKESDLATITLTPEAEKRLGLATAVLGVEPVRRTRVYGGEIAIPPGRAVTVAAPVAGRLAGPDRGGSLRTGATVAAGQTLLRLYALPPEHDLLRSQEDLHQAQIRRDQTLLRERRAEQLLKDKAGSARALEEARAESAAAATALEATQERLDLFTSGPSDATPDALTPLAIASPLTGMISALHAQPGQIVPAGARLLDVVDTARVWVRVPVYVGDLETIEPRGDAEVHGPADAAGAPGRTAKPIVGPPSADAMSATVDLFWELTNHDGALHPGQRVGVTVPLGDSVNSLVVPWAAILHDVYGGTWVYQNTEAHTYVRRRVAVREVIGDRAVLERGPDPGARVVTDGAAELFGTEFATGK